MRATIATCRICITLDYVDYVSVCIHNSIGLALQRLYLNSQLSWNQPQSTKTQDGLTCDSKARSCAPVFVQRKVSFITLEHIFWCQRNLLSKARSADNHTADAGCGTIAFPGSRSPKYCLLVVSISMNPVYRFLRKSVVEDTVVPRAAQVCESPCKR
jgi:hypothetical protein